MLAKPQNRRSKIDLERYQPENKMNYTILEKADLPPGGNVHLQKQLSKEILSIQEGSAILEAHAGQVIVVPAEIPHKFMNASGTQLQQIDIHISKEFITDWLED